MKSLVTMMLDRRSSSHLCLACAKHAEAIGVHILAALQHRCASISDRRQRKTRRLYRILQIVHSRHM